MRYVHLKCEVQPLTEERAESKLNILIKTFTKLCRDAGGKPQRKDIGWAEEVTCYFPAKKQISVDIKENSYVYMSVTEGSETPKRMLWGHHELPKKVIVASRSKTGEIGFVESHIPQKEEYKGEDASRVFIQGYFDEIKLRVSKKLNELYLWLKPVRT